MGCSNSRLQPKHPVPPIKNRQGSTRMRSFFEHHLRQAWQHRRWLSSSLWPLCLLYGVLVRIHQTLYQWQWRKPHVLPVPVVVVGNVLVGGVGKTPIVMALVEHFTQQGLRVGVVSRGYGRSAHAHQTSPVCEVSVNSLADDVGDEPLLIHKRCHVPVWVGAQRIEAARALLKAHPQVQLIISDDGLQHLALARDIELCVFDERGIGNGWLLPAGPMREPWPRRYTTPDVKRFELQTASPTSSPHLLNIAFVVQRRLSHVAMQADGTQREVRHWAQHPAQALAGVAKPQVFFDMLQAQGVQLANTLALPDHASADQLKAAVAQLQQNQADVLCTEKDAVKLWPFFPQVWAVPLVSELPEDLLHAVQHAVQSVLHSNTGSVSEP